jgi:hypothetical protein
VPPPQRNSTPSPREQRQLSNSAWLREYVNKRWVGNMGVQTTTDIETRYTQLGARVYTRMSWRHSYWVIALIAVLIGVLSIVANVAMDWAIHGVVRRVLPSDINGRCCRGDVVWVCSHTDAVASPCAYTAHAGHRRRQSPRSKCAGMYHTFSRSLQRSRAGCQSDGCVRQN